jgi:two-component system, OmpR family, phosphate regulon response regulator PhoB
VTRALIVEDERDVRELMVLHLMREGIDVVAVEDGEEATRALAGGLFSLVVLDWMLPGVSGLEICKRLRAQGESSAAILMVTARADTADVVAGLDAGADDYITKPFELPVFLARVRALKRRGETAGARKATRPLVIGCLAVDLEAHEVTCDGEPVALTPSEFRLISALMENAGRALSRERLIDLVQGENVTVVDRAIDTHVFGLRKKLGACADVIETIRGIGYRVRAP